MDEKSMPFNPDWDQLLERLEANEQSDTGLGPEEQSLLAELRALKAEAGEALKVYHSFDTNKQWADFRHQIGADTIIETTTSIPLTNSNENRARKLLNSNKEQYELMKNDRGSFNNWLRISTVAAAVLILTGIGLFYLKNVKLQQKQLVNIIKNDIAPGKNSATLTLDNGKKIVLSDATNGQLASEAGIVITKSAEGQVVYSVQNREDIAGALVHTLSTSKGETYRLRLPDQSEVWLNASSSIKFPASFATHKVREVELTGEAYFEIAKDKQHPFIVKTSAQEVQVLGTHFNLNNYGDQNSTTTTLLEGSLRILNNDKEGEIIEPGEQSVVAKGRPILVSTADIKETMAWKNGYFRFKAEGIDEIMLKISRWYNIEVKYEGQIPKERFSGNISRFKNISEVLNMLSYSNAVKFKVEGRRVTVMQ